MSARKLILTVSVFFVFIAAGFTPRSGAQIATVNVADPANPQVSYDEDPYAPEPYVPGDPATVYTEGVPPGSDPAASALALARIVTSTQANVTDPLTAQAPVVKTSNPDTYSLSAPTVYYTPPVEPPGPFVQHGAHLKFDFGPGALEPGYTRVLASTAYGPETGYGWGDTSKVIERDRGGDDELENDFCLPSGTQFYVDLPEGNYHVSLVTGDRIGRTRMAIRAEGLLQLYNMQTPTGKFLRDSFTVHVGDGRLMLEFIGTAPFVNAVEITRIPDDKPRKPTVFVASDSTAASYYAYSAPMAGWGHYLADYFDDGVAVDNQAKAGRSSKSFYEEGSLATIEDRIRPGDYLFVMFAINDSADDSSNRKTRPESTFKAYLRLYINSARSRGATPVFVTSQTKRTFDAWGRFTNSVGAYPQAMRELGAELNVPVIDLNRKSIEFFTSIGPEATKRSFMYLAPGEHPNYPNGLSDYIHFQETGAKQLAKLVAEGVKELGIQPLAQHVVLEPDTAPPALSLPGDITLEATGPAGAAANFEATAHDAVSGDVPVSYSHAPGNAFPLGTTAVTVTASDRSGNVASGTFNVTVRDTTAPDFRGLTASPDTLWSPNHRMAPVTLSSDLFDIADAAPTARIISVASSEPDSGTGEGDLAGDWKITGPLSLDLRAERAGGGGDRVYTITVQARDLSGNTSVRTVAVRVPHSQ